MDSLFAGLAAVALYVAIGYHDSWVGWIATGLTVVFIMLAIKLTGRNG
jgi:hypothetical protein